MKKIEKLAKELKKECSKTNCNSCPFYKKEYAYYRCELATEVDGYEYAPNTWNI